tara:strand:+ start:557 stop:1753 length:1197 start_codon:yes stop_codon:yes gene_type:complete
MENILFYNLDIKEVIERVQIGPQTEVLELIEDFNYKYGSHINKKLGITKKFYWRPGAYDTVKEIIKGLQGFDRKAQSLTKVVERVRSESAWLVRELDNKISSIENILWEFRRDGAIMQDNTDDAVEAWELLKNYLVEQHSNVNNVDIRVQETDTDYFLWITYMWNDFEISYKHVEGDEIDKVFCPGTLDISIKMSITKIINEIIRNKFSLNNLNLTSFRYGNRRSTYSVGGSYVNKFRLQHPFIARDNTYQNSTPRETERIHKYVCLGNLESEVNACIKSLDLVSLKVFLERLVLHYDTNTGPLNSLIYSFHGRPKLIDDDSELWRILGRTNIEGCSYRSMIKDAPIRFIKEESYCSLHCKAKDECDAYINNTKELSKEDRERIAIEQATLNAARRLQ